MFSERANVALSYSHTRTQTIQPTCEQQGPRLSQGGRWLKDHDDQRDDDLHRHDDGHKDYDEHRNDDDHKNHNENRERAQGRR